MCWAALAVIALTGCSNSEESSQSATRPAPSAAAPKSAAPLVKPPVATAPRRETIEVSSADQFVAAIGPDRVLRLREGKYQLSLVKQRYLKHLYWRQVHDGYELVVRNVKDLRIEAAEKGKVELLAKPAYGYVLAFEKSSGVELSGLVLGHSPDPGFCTGGVVQMTDCRNAAIRDCDLYGCGTEGLTLQRVEGLTFERSVIRDCTYGIGTLAGSNRIAFRDSRFINNKQFYGFEIRDCLGVKFERCQFDRNIAASGIAPASLFKIASSSEIEMIGGRITGNRYNQLTGPADAMKFERVDIRDNRPPPKE